jgi:hypothetical protein
MSVSSAGTSVHIGQRVVLRGTAIIGSVRRIDVAAGRGRITMKIVDVFGKPPGSKAARALRGAWVTCAPEMVAPASEPPR